MGEFINVLVSKGKSNLIPEKDNLYGQFVGEWDFEWVDNQGTTGERHVQGEWIFAWVLEGTAIQDVFICPRVRHGLKIINRMQLMRLRYVCIILIQRHGIFYIRN